MNFLERCEKKLRRFAIPNITLYLVVLQGFAFVLMVMQPPQNMGAGLERLMLVPQKVLEGEVWRLITFVFLPPMTNPLFAFFALYFFYLMGTALEGYWGTFRYNLYLLIGWAATLIAASITPSMPATNAYLGGSVFLAFAFLYPNFVIYLFFILPVRIKWLAMATWLVYAFTLILGSWSSRFQITAAVLNFLAFFGHRVFLSARYGMKHMSAQAVQLAEAGKPFHVCTTCGVTDKMNRTMEFRYCPNCDGSPGYCIAHINSHEHRKAVQIQSP